MSFLCESIFTLSVEKGCTGGKPLDENCVHNMYKLVKCVFEPQFTSGGRKRRPGSLSWIYVVRMYHKHLKTQKDG